MVVLKKGSQGNDVKALQTLLNKYGAKLKVNGDFDQLTDAAVRAFQKKCKLKVDGKVGDNTNAALEYGGPLPVMPLADYTDRVKHFQKMRAGNKVYVSTYAALGKEMAALAQLAKKETEAAQKVVDDNQATWDQIFDLAEQIVAKQSEFTVMLAKSPQKAEKLGKDCEKLEAQIQQLGKGKITAGIAKLNTSLGAVRAKMEATKKLYDAEIRGLQKMKEAIKK